MSFVHSSGIKEKRKGKNKEREWGAAHRSKAGAEFSQTVNQRKSPGSEADRVLASRTLPKRKHYQLGLGNNTLAASSSPLVQEISGRLSF